MQWNIEFEAGITTTMIYHSHMTGWVDAFPHMKPLNMVPLEVIKENSWNSTTHWNLFLEGGIFRRNCEIDIFSWINYFVIFGIQALKKLVVISQWKENTLIEDIES